MVKLFKKSGFAERGSKGEASKVGPQKPYEKATHWGPFSIPGALSRGRILCFEAWRPWAVPPVAGASAGKEPVAASVSTSDAAWRAGHTAVPSIHWQRETSKCTSLSCLLDSRQEERVCFLPSWVGGPWWTHGWTHCWRKVYRVCILFLEVNLLTEFWERM